jgi:signal transduction histidine kinase
MMDQSIQDRSSSGKYILGVMVVLALSLMAFYWMMHPPMSEIALMALFLSVTATISVIAGYIAYRYGWIERSPTIMWTILGSYVLSSLLTFINVWLTARLMFASTHDLQLATILLFFASGIAISFGYFFVATFENRISILQEATMRYSRGEFQFRVDVKGNDELASLGRTLNQMAASLYEAEQKKEELDQLRRELVAWSSHDLQTPLASVQAIIEALVDGVIDDPEIVQRYLHTAKRDVRAMSLLLDDLFQMAQIDAGGIQLAIEPGSLSDLISDTLESFRKLADERNITLHGDVEPGMDPVQIDTVHLGRVLNNLISNAFRYTQTGGVIDVIASRRANGVEISVVDNGSGIQPEDLPYIFDRFYRGEKSRSRTLGGSGLGLAIAKGIIEAHHGTITVASLPNFRTEFKVWLPVEGPQRIQRTKDSSK